MIMKRINLYELQGTKMNRPEMRFLVGGCGGCDDAGVTCDGNGCGICYSAEWDDKINAWVGCYANGNPASFCVYGK